MLLQRITQRGSLVVAVLLLANCTQAVMEDRSFHKVSVETPFIVNKQENRFTENERIILANAFIEFIVLHVDPDLRDGQRKRNRRRELEREELSMTSSSMLRNHRRGKSLPGYILDPSSIEVTALTTCPFYSTRRFYFCQQAQAQFDILIFDDSTIGTDDDIVERYQNATRDGIDNGVLQEYVDDIALEVDTTAQHNDIVIIGDPQTVANEFPIIASVDDLYTMQSSFYVINPINDINDNDREVLETSFETLIVHQVFDETKKVDERLRMSLVDRSLEIVSYERCPSSDIDIDLSGYIFCHTALYRYQMFKKAPKAVTDNDATVAGSSSSTFVSSSNDNVDIYELYSNATKTIINDGTFAQIIQAEDPTNTMIIVLGLDELFSSLALALNVSLETTLPRSGVDESQLDDETIVTLHSGTGENETAATSSAVTQSLTTFVVGENEDEEADKEWYKDPFHRNYIIIEVCLGLFLVGCVGLAYFEFVYKKRKQRKQRYASDKNMSSSNERKSNTSSSGDATDNQRKIDVKKAWQNRGQKQQQAQVEDLTDLTDLTDTSRSKSAKTFHDRDTTAILATVTVQGQNITKGGDRIKKDLQVSWALDE